MTRPSTDGATRDELLAHLEYFGTRRAWDAFVAKLDTALAAAHAAGRAAERGEWMAAVSSLFRLAIDREMDDYDLGFANALAELCRQVGAPIDNDPLLSALATLRAGERRVRRMTAAAEGEKGESDG